MNERMSVRTEAILDGITGVAGIPSIASFRARDRYAQRHTLSDVDRSWKLVGKYMSIAIQDFEAETPNAPTIRAAISES